MKCSQPLSRDKTNPKCWCYQKKTLFYKYKKSEWYQHSVERRTKANFIVCTQYLLLFAFSNWLYFWRWYVNVNFPIFHVFKHLLRFLNGPKSTKVPVWTNAKAYLVAFFILAIEGLIQLTQRFRVPAQIWLIIWSNTGSYRVNVYPFIFIQKPYYRVGFFSLSLSKKISYTI